MEVSKMKALSLGILLINLMILLNTSPTGATSASVLKDFQFHGLNATTSDYMESEFLHSSKIGRMLVDDKSFVTFGALIANEAVVTNCGRRPYTSCVGRGGNPTTGENCGPTTIYNRNC